MAEEKTFEGNIIAAAIAGYEVVRAMETATLGTELPQWDEAPEWIKARMIGATRICDGIRDASPESLHDYWRSSKLVAGWVFGKTYNKEEKTHPKLVAFDQLPFRDRARANYSHLAITSVLQYFRKTKGS